MNHGLAGYRRHGCKCEVCTKANRDAGRRVRQNRAQRLDEAPHGTESGYLGWGCRGECCRQAHTETRRLERALKSDRPTRTCTVCEGKFKIKEDGTLWAHGWTGPYGQGHGHCLGSGEYPADWQAGDVA